MSLWHSVRMTQLVIAGFEDGRGPQVKECRQLLGLKERERKNRKRNKARADSSPVSHIPSSSLT